MRKTYNPLLISVAIVGIVFAFYYSGLRILINQSGSLPGYVYIYNLGAPVSRGDLVTFRHPNFPMLLLKRVVGVAGDTVTIQGNVVLINGTAIGTLQRTTSKGETLVPISPQTIPDGQWFVMGDHPKSHDSRYASFGLIPTKNLVGKAWGVF